MDAAGFGAFQQQIKRNQNELQDYLKDLDSWKDSMAKREQKLKSTAEQSDKTLPPVRNSLFRKKKIKKKKQGERSAEKTKRIPGYDFRAWDKYDVDAACNEVEERSSSSYEEETDEEWEEEKMKQQAIFEKDQGNAYFKKQKYEEAINSYTNGIQCDPANAVLYANRAMALLKIDRYGAAEKDCTDAIVLDPTYIKAYMRRGTARQKLGKLEPGLEDFRQTLKLEPDNKLAAKEVAKLEKDLEISREGIVLPVKKSHAERSKKLLVRIDVAEIDDDHIKTRLQEAVAKTTAKQSEEKKRVVAKDNEMFSKFTDVAKSNEEPKAETSGSSILSPADIGKLNLTDNQEKETILETKLSPRLCPPADDPVTSPRLPTNSYQFQKDWKTVKNDADRIYRYLQKIEPASYPKLFGQFLEADVMSKMLHIFSTRFLRDNADITEHMFCLGEVKRFTMTVMLMSSKDKSVVKEILGKLSGMGASVESINRLSKLYEVA